MVARKHTQELGLVEQTIRPIGGTACAFLRSVRIAGGRINLLPQDVARAKECARVGYVQISEDGKIVRLTGVGQIYLDRLMRAH